MRKKLAKLDDLPEGTTKRFSFKRDGIRVDAFVANYRGEIVAFENLCRHQPLTLDYGDGEHVVIDRAFEAESRARAGAYGPGFEAAKARWEPSNPNVCTLESATGALLELKVTKRSFESPGPGGFGSSEYSRVAVAQGGVAAVPQILARRLQTRYRFDDNASMIEALEIQNVYDPQASGFADLNGAQPVATVKSRLTLSR